MELRLSCSALKKANTEQVTNAMQAMEISAIVSASRESVEDFVFGALVGREEGTGDECTTGGSVGTWLGGLAALREGRGDGCDEGCGDGCGDGCGEG